MSVADFLGSGFIVWKKWTRFIILLVFAVVVSGFPSSSHVRRLPDSKEAAPGETLSLKAKKPSGLAGLNAPDDVTVCEGERADFSVESGSTWQWQISVGGGAFTDISKQVTSNYSISSTTASMSGNQYRCIIDGVESAAATLTVNRKPVVTTSSTINICTGSGTNITLSSTVASTYTWKVGAIVGSITGASDGAGTEGSKINQTLTNPSTSNVGSVEYIITPTSTAVGGCVGDAKTIKVMVNPIPAMTPIATVTISNGTSTNIALSASQPSSFNWTATSSASISGISSGSGSTINQVLTNSSGSNGTATYTVTPTSLSGSCAGSPYSILVLVKATPILNVPAVAPICTGTSPKIALSATTPSTFSWTIGTITEGVTGAAPGTGSTIDQILNNPSTSTAGTVEYLVTPTSPTTGTGATFSVVVTVNPKPVVTNSPSYSICSGSAANLALTANVPCSYKWTVGAITGGISGATAGAGTTITQVLTNPGFVPGTVAYMVTPTSLTGSCDGDPFEITVTVYPVPVVTNLPTASTCSGSAPNLALTATLPSTFSWTVGANTGGISGASAGSGGTLNQILVNPSKTFTGSIEYFVTPTSIDGACVGSPFKILVSVNPGPSVNNAIVSTTCSGTSPALSLTASVPSTYSWTVGTVTGGILGSSSGSGSSINQILTNPSSTIAGSVQYLVSATSVSDLCTGSSYPITVTVNPKPAMTSSPSASVCSGATTNIPLSASIPSTYTWTVGAITGGIAGAGPGSGSSINQILTNPNSAIPGTVAYIVTPKSISGSCTGNPFTITVTVLPEPTITNPASISSCSGSSPNIQLKSNVPCNFSWTIGANAGGISGATAGSGTTINQVLINPSTTFPGSVDYIVTPTSVSGACAGAPFTITVNVYPVPAVTNTATTSTCSGTSPNINLTASLPSTFAWTVGTITGGITGATAGSGLSINQVLTNPSPLIAGTVQYLVTPISIAGSCAGATFPIVVTVLPSPIVTSPATVNVNSGLATAINLTASSASTFAWTIGSVSGGITGAVAGTGSSINQVLNNPGMTNGTVTYIVTPTSTANSCIGTPFTITATVFPLPVLTSSTNPPAICSGAVFSYQPTGTPGAIFSWSRAAVAGISNTALTGVGNPNETLINTSNIPVTVNYIYTVTANGYSNPSTYTVSVVVNPTPSLTGSLTPPATCSGTTFSYLPTSGPAVATFNWSRAAVPGISNLAATGTDNPNEILVNTTNSVVNVTYVYTVSAYGCTRVQNVTVPVTPNPILTSSLNPPAICSGSSFSYVPTTSVVGTVASWNRPVVAGISNPVASGNGNPNEILINTTPFPIVVTYNYSLNLNGCTSPVNYAVNVTINPSPVLTSGLSPLPVCTNTLFSYTPTSSAAGTNYSWSRAAVAGISNAPATGSGAVNETLVNTTALSINVTYVYSLTALGCSNTQNVVVAVSPLPSLSGSLTPPAVCSGNTFNYNPTSNTPNTSFTWSRSAVAGISNASASGSGNPAEVLVNTTNSPISVTYSYTLNAGGCSNSQNVTVTVNPLPVLTSNPLPAPICSGTIFNYSPTSSTTGATFNWSRAAIPNIANGAASGTGSPNETLINTSAISQTVTYLYSVSVNGCMNPTTFPVSVVVNPLPALSSGLTAPTICTNSVFSYIPLSNTAGTTFNWSRSAIPGISNSPAFGSNNPLEVLTNTTTLPLTVNYQYTLSANGCSNTQNVGVIVNPYPVLTSTLSPPNICGNTVFSYTPTSSTPGTTFSWSRPFIPGISNLPATGTGSPNEILVNTTPLPIPVVYTYSLSINGCTSPTTYNVIVNVNPLPTLSSTLTPNPICSNSTFVYTPTSANGIISGWTRAAVAGISNPAASGTSNPNETLVNTTSLPINVTYVYSLTLGGCVNTQNVVVTVNPSPVLSGSLSPGAVCSNSIFSYSPASNTPGAVFNWSRANVSGISNASGSGSGNPNETLINTTSLAVPVTYVYQTSANGCSSTQNVVVQVSPLPVLTSTQLAPAICSNSTFSYTPQSSTIGTTFSWSRSAVAGIANAPATGNGNPNETLLNLTASAVNVTYIYTLSANGCTNPVTFPVVVSVNPSAVLTSSLTPPAICSGSIFSYNATSSTTGAVLTWSRPTLTGIVQPASAGSGDINETLTNSTANPIAVTYLYTLFVNGCTRTQNVTVTVNPTPVLSSSLSPPAICSGTTLHYAATSATPGVTFNWSRLGVAGILQPPSSGTGNVNETLTNTTGAPVNVTYVYSLSANSCNSSNTFNVVVTVNPIPANPVVTVTGSTSFCEGDHVVLTAPSGFTYQWSNGASTQSIEVGTTGSFSVVVKDAIGCPSSPSAPAIATTALPAPAPPTSGGDITQCLDTPVAQTIVPTATAPAGCTLKWYDASSGGNLVAAPSFSGLGIKSFYAESVNTTTGCTSLTRTQVTINIISHPAAPIKDADVVECEKSPLQTLTATATVPVGYTITWYSSAAGGLPVTPTLHAVGTVSYYAEANNGLCSSLTRTKVTLTINPAPPTPVSLGNITECENVPIQTLTALSSNPAAIWYSTSTGGSPVGSPTLSAVGSATYYAESVLGGCSSLSRSTGVVLTITATPEPPVSGGDIIQCEMNPIQTLTAVATPPPGATVKWYTTPTGGVAVGSPTINSATTKTYYAESEIGTCKSLTRTAVLLQIKAAPKPPVAGKSITECATLPNVQTLTATATTTSGSTLSWFETATGGDPVTPTLNQIGTVTYYAEANNGNCSSTARSSGVVLTINPTPDPPVAINVTECAAKPLQVLTPQTEIPPTGVTISWYNSATGGTVVSTPILKTIGTKIFYAESKLDKCINPTRTPVTLTINSIVSDPILKVKGRDSIVVCESAPIDTLDARDLFTVVPTVTYVCFDSATGGFEVSPLLDYAGTKTVYVAAKSIATGCLSFNRIPVKLVIHSAPLPPVSTGDIFECTLKPVQILDANKSIVAGSGTKVVWYDKANGGSVVAKPTLSKADTTVYYFAESVDLATKCVSLSRTQVKLTLGSTKASASSNSPLALGQTLQLKGGPDMVGNNFYWTDPNGFAFATMDVTIPNVSESAAGMYHLTVTSANGCTASDSIKVIIDIANAEAQTPICIGSTLYLSGYPNNMKAYAWTGPGGFTSSLQNPSIDHVSIANSGTYTLTVTNINNATSSDTVSVSFKPLPLPIAEATTLCPSGMMQLNAGPNGMTSYLWSGPNGFTSKLQKPAPMPYLNPSEEFKLTVVDWNGCEASKVITPKPFQPTASSNSPLCTGDTLRLRGEPNGMAVYRWSGPNNFLSNLQSPTINNVNAATATGDYTLTVIDKEGCTYSTRISVSFNTPPPIPTITPNINPICEGSTLILNGGPSAMAGYDWTGPDGFISKDQNPQITNVKDINAGKYSLKITTPEGCKNTFETNVSVLSVKFNGTYGPYCINDSPVTLSVTPSGGTFSGPGVSGNIFDPKIAGEGTHTIQYTYSGSGGLCTVVSYKYIDVVTVPTLVTNNPVLPSCTGSTADLTLPAVTLGSTPGLILSYWTDAKATLGLPSPKAVSAGMYYIKGATISGKCYDIKPVRVMQPDSLRATLKIKPTDCYGDTTGTMEATITMGTAPYTYLWSTTPVQTNAKAVSLKAGVYTVVITDAKMCSIALTDTVKEANPFKMYFSKNNIDCLSDANGSAKVDSVLINGVKADINGYTYAWNSKPIQTTRQAVKLTYGYFTIALTNNKGCTVRDSVFIDALDSVPPTIICPKDIDMIVHATKSADGSPNTIDVDLGQPIAKDNCTIVNVVNDAPEKFRVGRTVVTWTVTDQSGMVDTCQQVVNIKEFPTIPQLVSPNGDGINDTFVIEGLKAFPQSQLLIFTRSGQLVYQSNDYKDDWDGRYGASTFSHNKLVAPGVYYYVLSLGGGSKQKVQGYVYIYY